MIKDEAYKRFLKSSEEINEILFTMDLDKIKPSNKTLKLNLKLLELVNEQKNLIKEVEEAILKGKNQELKDYILSLLENLEKQKDIAKSKINSSEKFYEKNFTELSCSLIAFRNMARENRLQHPAVLHFFCDILIFSLKEIKILLHNRRPKIWPSEDAEDMQQFIKIFRKEESKVDRPFIDQKVADACYQLLIEMELIDSNFAFLGKDKAAFCLLIEKLKNENKKGKPIIENLSYKKYADLLNEKFQGLELHPSNFTKPMTRAVRDYNDKMSKFIRNTLQNLIKT